MLNILGQTLAEMYASGRSITAGDVLAGMYAFCCSVTACGVFVGMHLIGVGFVLYAVAGLLFVATLWTNYRMCRIPVTEVLSDIFGKERLFQGLFETENGLPLTKFKRYLISIGLFLAISVGATFAALNFFGAITLASMFAFGAASILIPPIAAILAGLVFIVMTALMLRSIAIIIKTDNLFLTCKEKLFDLVNIDQKLPRNQEKSLQRIILERVATVFLFLVFLPLSILGLVMTMNACSNGLGNVLLKIPYAAPSVVYIASKIITFGLAFLGQLPFVVRTSAMTASQVFESKLISEDVKNNAYFGGAALKYINLILRAISAIGNGVVAMSGASEATAVLAVTGGTINSFASATEDSSKKNSIEIIEIEMGDYPINYISKFSDSSKHPSAASKFLDSQHNTLLHISNPSETIDSSSSSLVSQFGPPQFNR